MADRPRPGLQQFHEFTEKDKVSEEFQEYIFSLHRQLAEALLRIEELENA